MTAVLTEKQKRVIDWLVCGHLRGRGGYHFLHEIHAGRVFVAGVDDTGAAELDSYAVDDLERWYDDAAAYMAEEYPGEEWLDDGFGAWGEAFIETA